VIVPGAAIARAALANKRQRVETMFFIKLGVDDGDRRGTGEGK